MRLIPDGDDYLILDVTKQDLRDLWLLLPKGVTTPSCQDWNLLVDPIMGDPPEVIVPADVNTDDHQHREAFDAVCWFQYASDDAIVALAKCGWGGDYPADDVARYIAEKDVMGMDCPVGHLLRIAERTEAGLLGFECHVNKERALAWLKENRTNLFADLVDKGLTD